MNASTTTNASQIHIFCDKLIVADDTNYDHGQINLLNPSLCDKLVIADGIKRSNITVVTLAFARIKLV